MSAHNSATAIFPSSKSSGGKRVAEPGGFHANFASQNSDFRMPQMKGVQQMRTAPGSANKDPTKVPFLCHQSREFQPGFVTGFFCCCSIKRGEKQIYIQKSSAGSKNVSEFNNLVKEAPPYLITTPAEKKLN